MMANNANLTNNNHSFRESSQGDPDRGNYHMNGEDEEYYDDEYDDEYSSEEEIKNKEGMVQ
jgi:hypothetical protein